MIYSLSGHPASSDASSYGGWDSPRPSREAFLFFHPLDRARVPGVRSQHTRLSLQMLGRGCHPLLTSLPSEFTQIFGILSISDHRSYDHDGRHCLKRSSVKRSFKPGGLLSVTVRLQKRKTASDFTCSSCRADLSRTSEEKQYRSSAETLNESDRVSIWDSNAESIRRSRRKSRPSSADVRPDERAPRNWDYASDTESRRDNWQWWRILEDDDTYDDDTDDDDDTGFSWFNFDIKSALSMLGWMFPAAFVFLPWLLGSPLLITLAFALFPLALKLFGPLLPENWSALSQSWSSKQKRRKRSSVSNKDGTTSRSDTGKPFYSGFSTWGKYGRSLDSIDDDSRQEAGFKDSGNEGRARHFTHSKGTQGQSLKLGGWDELEDETVLQGKLTQNNRKAKLDRRRRQKEVPLFFRLLIALFPFLRSWGGFL